MNNNPNFKFLQQFIKEQTAIVIDLEKEYLIEARLGPIVRPHPLSGWLDGCEQPKGLPLLKFSFNFKNYLLHQHPGHQAALDSECNPLFLIPQNLPWKQHNHVPKISLH